MDEINTEKYQKPKRNQIPVTDNPWVNLFTACTALTFLEIHKHTYLPLFPQSHLSVKVLKMVAE